MIRIGKLVATHGIRGTLIMTHIAGKSSWLSKGNVLMIEMQKGSLIPYFVADCKAVSNEEYHVSIEDVDSQEDAKHLVSRHVYVDEALLTGMSKESPLLWIGFSITDMHYGDLGKIADVMQTGAQWIATLNYKGVEALIPLVDETIKKVDFKKKSITTSLPEGLLEVYE